MCQMDSGGKSCDSAADDDNWKIHGMFDMRCCKIQKIFARAQGQGEFLASQENQKARVSLSKTSRALRISSFGLPSDFVFP